MYIYKKRGSTALTIASSRLYKDIIELLLNKHANINIQNYVRLLNNINYINNINSFEYEWTYFFFFFNLTVIL